MEAQRKRLRTDTEGRKVAGQKLRQLREAAGLSADEAAEKLGVSGTMVNLWEVGRSFPSMEHLRDVLRLYGGSADWLLGLVPPGLEEEEAMLLGCYRRLEPIYRRGLREAARGMLDSSGDSDEVDASPS